MNDDAPLKIPSNEERTFWNKDASVGLSIGILIGSLPLGLIGMFIGGMMGKSRIENEQQNGKIVEKPSFWNKSTVIGAGIGHIAGELAGIAILFTAGLSAAPAAFASIVAGALAGMIIGGESGKKQLQEEYNQALSLREQTAEMTLMPGQSMTISMSPDGQQVSYKNSVSPDETAALQSRTKEGDPTRPTFTSAVEAARQQPVLAVAAQK